MIPAAAAAILMPTEASRRSERQHFIRPNVNRGSKSESIFAPPFVSAMPLTLLPLSSYAGRYTFHLAATPPPNITPQGVANGIKNASISAPPASQSVCHVYS